jgi:hypothetical protein
MGTDLDGNGERTVVRCIECETTSAALIDESGNVVTPQGECEECGADEFEEVPTDALDESSMAEDWAT